MRWTAANVSLLLLPGIILIPALPHAFGGTRVFVHGLSEYSGALEKEDAKAKIAAHREALEFVRNSPGPVFSEDMLLLVQAGKEVPAEPSTVVELARHSQWDETPFVQMINEKRFSAIVVTSSLDNSARFSPAVAQAIRQTYEQSLHIGSEYRILLPRGQE
jgi:hypothetical protein